MSKIEAASVATAILAASACGGVEFDVEIEDVELQPYATAEHFSLVSEVTASRRPAADTTVEARVVLRVVAGL